MIHIIVLALVGAVLASVIGTLWYMPQTPMGKIHMKSLGFDTLSPEEQKQKMQEGKAMMKKMYAGQFLLSFLTSFAVVFIVRMSLQNGLSFLMATGFVTLNWLCFMVPIIGSGILWSNCDRSIAWPKFFSDIFANLVTLLVIAYLARLFI